MMHSLELYKLILSCTQNPTLTHTHTRIKPIEINLLKLAIIFVGFLASCKGATTWQKPKNVKVSAENCKEYLQINASYQLEMGACRYQVIWRIIRYRFYLHTHTYNTHIQYTRLSSGYIGEFDKRIKYLHVIV